MMFELYCIIGMLVLGGIAFIINKIEDNFEKKKSNNKKGLK